MKPTKLGSHLIALLMPITIVILIPGFILQPHIVPEIHVLNVGLAAIFIVAGLCLFVITFRLFVKVGKGTLAPWDPTQHLVIQGPYRYCRNPMISAVLSLLVGETILYVSLVLLCYAIAFFVINTVYFILREEPDLERKHGEEYRRYKKAVPRWFPRLKPYLE